MITRTLPYKMGGIIARPAGKIVLLCQKFSSVITVTSSDLPGLVADGRSIMEVMMLLQGEIEFCIDGPDELEAMKCIVDLFADNFGIKDC